MQVRTVYHGIVLLLAGIFIGGCPSQKRIERDFQSYVNGKRINIATLKRFDRLWTRNIFKNCAHFFILPGVEALRDRGRGFPAVILAAGPSQEAQLPLLQKLQDRAILIAVDTVAQPLMKRHIIM